MYRPQTSNVVDDIRYYSDGSGIMYNNWITGDPNNSGQKEYCVAALQYYDNKWGDSPCTSNAGLICEL